MSRDVCEKCTRPKTVCYCDEIVRFTNEVTLIILQHPDEQKHPLNSAKMANLSFENSYLLIGETFDQSQELQTLLTNKKPAILYPHETGLSLESNLQNQFDTLIVLDGTWRKAKRIFNETKLLHALPFVQLTGNYKSIYTIRKAPEKNLLSTLEASVLALNCLDQQNYSEAINVLRSQIKKHIDFMGNEKFHKFYGN